MKKMKRSEDAKLITELLEDYISAFYANIEGKEWRPNERVGGNLKRAAEIMLAQQEAITALTRELYGKAKN